MIITHGKEAWDRHFLKLAAVNAALSKDPSTQVGAVIVTPDRVVRSMGFNGFPRGIKDTADRLGDRNLKLKLIVHAEMNAITNAARGGAILNGCTLYLMATDSSGAKWGGCPCSRCSVHVIQAGIAEVVSYPFKLTPSRWAEDIAFARGLLDEAGVRYREIAV